MTKVAHFFTRSNLMSKGLPPEIESGLVSLRRRIRKIQLYRGLLGILTVAAGGMLLIVALDYFLAPLPSMARAALFFLWLAAILVALVKFLLVPIMSKLSLVRLARWLENQHPEVQERISTALEISRRPEGVSPELLAELSKEAASDISSLDPQTEVKTRRIRRSLWPAAAVIVAILGLLAFFPREMGRLLARAVSPFSELGNAGAFRFELKPGDLEVLEGDQIVLDLTYSGSLEKPLELLIEKDGEVVSEVLSPSKSEDGTHVYQYTVAAADEGFKYSARVGGAESDRFKVKVYPLPRLLEPTVTFQYPAYTEWPDRKSSLGAGIQALAGTKVNVSGRFDTPLESGQLLIDGEEAGEIKLEGSASGTKASWTQELAPGQAGLASMMVKHQLGRELEGARFSIEAIEDPAPEVSILTPVQREFKVKPDDQIVITYEVVEAIGLSKAEIELEINGESVQPLLKILPTRLETARRDQWEGEAMVYLGNIVAEHEKARKLRLRLALHDNRPSELDGPGIGYSEWLEVTLNKGAESLARQELKKQDSDFRETVQKAITDIHEARAKMREARNEVKKEEVSEKAEKKLSEAREQLQEAKEALSELTERMEQGIQAHRADDIEEAIAKIEEAQTSVEHSPLQDTPEARDAEIENALKESEEAIQQLEKTRDEVAKDHPKMEDLAKLQEMAQKQEQLAREAAENAGEAPDDQWKNEQRQMQDQLREEVRQTPEAKASALQELSEMAKDLAEEAADLKESQEQLAELSEGIPEAMSANEIAEELKKEQQEIVNAIKEELAEAQKGEEARAEDLPKALEEAQEALKNARQSKPEQAAESADKAAEKLAKGAEEAPSQQALAEKQEKVAEAFEALAEGDTQKAQEALEEIRNAEKSAEAIAEGLAKEQEALVADAKEELADAQAAGEESRAEDLPKAIEEAEQALNQANQSKPAEAAESAQNAAEEMAKGSEESSSQEALAEKQEQLAEAFEALAEGDTAAAREALENLQEARMNEAIAEALAKEQEAIVEGARQELSEARNMQEARANDLPEAVAQAEAALEGAQEGSPEAAAEAAQNAAEELGKGAEEATSQQALAEKQEQLAEAFEALAEGKPQEALAALESMQAERGEQLAQDIQNVPQVEGDQLGTARSEAQQGAQKASQAAQSQSDGNSQMAEQQHQQAAEDFGQAQNALEQAAASFEKQAMAAAEQEANSRKAPAPGEQLAEAFEQSAEAANAESGQEAAQSSEAAAQALRQAANQAKSAMQSGMKPGQAPPQPGPKGPPQPPGQPGQEPGDDPDNQMRQAQADQGIPPELAKLGISASDWEKIQATLKSEVSGSGGSIVPDDYRGLVKQYFEQVSKER